MSIQKRLRAAMNKAGISNTELAQHCGVSVQGVGKWLKLGTIKKEHLPVIAKLTGVEYQWLATGERLAGNGNANVKYNFEVQETPATYALSDEIAAEAVRQLLPRAGIDATFIVAQLLNDLRTGRLSESDLKLLKPLIQRFTEERE